MGEFRALYDQLISGGQAEAELDEFQVRLGYIQAQGDLTLSTVIYEGEQFIPQSIRRALARNGLTANDGTARASIMLEPVAHQVVLNYSTHLEDDLDPILDQYIALAHDWKETLSEFD
jgi:hypothetical protein